MQACGTAFLSATVLTLRPALGRPLCNERAPHAKRRRAHPRMSAPTPEERRESEFVLDGGRAGGAKRAPFDWEAWRTSKEPAEIPMLPFPPEDIFLPGEVKRLHLFEARYLALFERAVLGYDRAFAHVLFAADRAALAAYGAIVRVRSWRRLELGVYVEIEATARFRVSKLERAAPFWAGTCAHVDDAPPADAAEAAAALAAECKLWRSFRAVTALCARLGADPVRKKALAAAAKAPADGPTAGVRELPPPPSLAADNGLFFLSPDARVAMWESALKAAARRAGNDEAFDFAADAGDEEARLRRARALSFAAFDFFPSTSTERQRALEGQNTLARLQSVVKGLDKYGKSLAAKAAVQDALKDQVGDD